MGAYRYQKSGSDNHFESKELNHGINSGEIDFEGGKEAQDPNDRYGYRNIIDNLNP
jgi:hypothetical protein